MPDISDIIQAIARQRGRGESGPLILLRQLDGAPGDRISHLPVDSELAQAWVALTSEPFRPHQAQALTALRRGEPVALAAASDSMALTAYLLLYATLLAEPHATALLVAPDDVTARAARDQLDHLNGELPQSLRLTATLLAPDRRPDHYARVVIATPATLHGRLLRHHDRAWSIFWPRLRLAILPEVQRYTGVAGAHMADLLLRLQRVAAAHSGGEALGILATLLPCEAPEPALAALLGQSWRVIAASDGPYEPAWLAVWRNPDGGKGGNGRLREAADLATTIRRQGYLVHIACEPLETALLAPLVGDVEGVSWGPVAPPAQVLIAAGYPGSLSAVRRMLRSGHQAVIVVLGDLPHEQALARQTEMLLSGPLASWPAPAPNAYTAAQHVLCAASELPLTEAEVDAWGAQDIVGRLAAQGQLVDLPDPEVAWKPTDAAGDPYAEFSTLAASGSAILARNEQGQQLAALDPTGFERWTFKSAALPPGAGGFRVVGRDEESGSVTLRLEGNGRRSYPLRRCEVAVREERETRTLAGSRRIGWGRVVVDEQIYGYREATAGSAPADLALQPQLAARWAAPACWFDVDIGAQVLGQFVGWSLAAALPLRTLAMFTDLVPCYDHAARRLYFVDAQPGGSGLAAWIYAHAEDLLPLAYDVALACRNDPLLEPLCRADMDWLLALLGRAGEVAPPDRARVPEPARVATRAEKPIRPELIEGPPPATPRIILTPAPPAEERAPKDEERRAAAPPTSSHEAAAPAGKEPKSRDDARRPAQPPIYNAPAPAPAAPSPPTPPASTPPAPAPPDQARRARDEGRRADQQARNGGSSPTDQRQRTPERPAAREPHRPVERRPATPQPPERRQSELPLADSQPAPQHRGGKPPPAPEPPRRPEAPATPGPQQARREPGGPAHSQPPDNRGKQSDADVPPDPAALIARLRRQREQREQRQGPAGPPGAARSEQAGPIEQRFAAGERIFCLPYGDGVVRESRIEGGRELLTVDFANHGDLTIDPAVNFVRKLEDAPEDDDLL